MGSSNRPTGDFDRLWAPWRHALFTGRRARRCIFCAAKRSREDRRTYVIARGKAVFAILNRFPYNTGHLMIAPYRHVSAFEALTSDEWSGMFRLSRTLLKRLRTHLHPQGFNVGMNLGKVAGAGIPGHVHLHIVPRWNGDTNFMPLLAHARVLSQSLDALQRILTRA